MNKLRFFTSGESHGKGLTGIIEGIPSGLELSSEEIDAELKRRQGGYGRGGRMKIESDHAEILSGVRWGKTLGSPISIIIENRDWNNWLEGMSAEGRYKGSIEAVTRPRPGHADLAGALKYNHKDIRNILERSSARETAMRVALGSVAKRFLREFGIDIGSYVIRIGSISIEDPTSGASIQEFKDIFKKAEHSDVRCPDELASKKIMELIDEAVQKGDSLGGIFKVFATGVPPGLGSHIQWDKKLDARLSYAITSIQAIKGVAIGSGFEMAEKFGSEIMDEIFYDSLRFYRKTNHAGGIEGGITNGMPIVIKAAMKPIPTLRTPLRSVDIITKEPFKAAYERSDTCAVPAAAIVAEAMTSLILADAALEKFGGDSIEETKKNYNAYIEYLKQF